MNPITRSDSSYSTYCPSLGGLLSLPRTKLTRLFKASVLGALALASPATSLRDRVRYDGGVIVPLPDFSVLAAPRQEFGPIYTPALQCLIMEMGQCSEGEASSLAAYAGSVSEEAKVLAPYLEQAGVIPPTYANPLNRFPENLSAFFSNGLGIIGNGEKGCLLDGEIDKYRRCEAEIGTLTYLIKREKLEEKIYTGNPDDEGLIISNSVFEGKPFHVVVRRDPQEHANFHAALKYVEENWLQSPCFFNRSENELLSEISKVHALLAGEKTANFRKQHIFVSRSAGNTLEDFVKKLQEMRATRKEIKLFTDSYQKVLLANQLNIKTVLTKGEQNVWEKLIYFPPDVETVPVRMKAFVSNLRKLAMSDKNPVALAAWAHCEFGAIHPYTDYNGREARLIMNAILVRGGYSPVIFPDDDEYSSYVNADQKSPGAFAAYLAKLIEAQREGAQVLSYGEKEQSSFFERLFNTFIS